MIYLELFLLAVLIQTRSRNGPIRILDDQKAILEILPGIEKAPRPWLSLWNSHRIVFDAINFLNYRLCRFWAPAWHWANYVLHGFTTITLYALLLRLRWPEPEWIAAGFAVCPIQVSNVSYITGRAGVFAGLFLFLGSLLYLEPFPYRLLSIIPFLLANLSRQDSIVFLLWLPFLEFWR